jgi:hypothetical protein
MGNKGADGERVQEHTFDGKQAGQHSPCAAWTFRRARIFLIAKVLNRWICMPFVTYYLYGTNGFNIMILWDIRVDAIPPYR